MPTIDISHIEVKPFRLTHKKINWGAFVALRWLFSWRSSGGRIWHEVLYFSTLILIGTPLAFITDIIILLIWGLIKLMKLFFEGLLWMLKLILTELIKSVFGKVFIFTIIILITILLIFRWSEITGYFINLFDAIFKL